MNASRTPPHPDQFSPDATAIADFLDLVFGDTHGFVPVRLLTEKGTQAGKPWSKYPPVGQYLAGTIVLEAERAAREGRGIFIVPGTVAQPGSAKAREVCEMAVILVDLDEGDIEAKRAHLVEHLGVATLEVASGGKTSDGADKLHIYWCLTEAGRGDDIGRICRLRKVLALKAGGDPSFGSAHQPIRVPGSIHGKQGRRAIVRIVGRSAQKYDLDEFAEAVARMPVLPGQAIIPASTPTAKPGPTARQLMTRVIREGGSDGTTRFDALSRVIGHWIRQARSGQITLDEAWDAVQNHNAAVIAPPWPDDRLRQEFDALLQRDTRSTGPIPAALAKNALVLPIPELSEDALAASFVATVGQVWRHVAIWGTWMYWDGTYWAKDELGAVREAVRQVCRAAVVGHDKPSEARRIASDKTIAAVLRIAATDPQTATSSDAWDQAPMLLNTPDGIVDLATGEVLPHDPARMLTQITIASPGSSCPRWERFIDEITGGDHELAAYLARLSGYCLTGAMREQVFFFLHGAGGNGKSVLLKTLLAVMGSYATTAPLDTFMAASGERHPTDLAGLRGARLVTVTETEEGRAWAETRIKTITGGDPIKARFMHRDFFEFAPSFKLIISGNHRPRLNGVGEAMRRRLHLVPFTVTFTDQGRDASIEDALTAERDGILGWMLKGCTEWQRIGLAPPATILEAVEEYFADEDLFGQWIAEQCITGPSQRATAADLFGSWSSFADRNGIPRGSQKSLGEAMRQRGFRPARSPGARRWQGISVRMTGEPEA
ncbi:hypothetical protein GCM10008024_14360 [Allgaiera indica]|uniref:Phage/plasmid primase, P4 family, C-terminal domain-containing protein n=1 Tax=Allgaiera indica TaxID=765699 RepID=A0AAN4ZYW6_9RHOB|nr:phage/plasmid primase, P4 family [Allgaiera indica]GHE00896.1 hypothetical protein GCM10008024_14360 [Allgaiera indica]SDW74039.1 phage/plasmid primase, P4 family, C-terminal domain-containing protein [Allgaiera indica]